MKFFAKNIQTSKKPRIFFKLGLATIAAGITFGSLTSCKTTYPTYDAAKKAYYSKFEQAGLNRGETFFESMEAHHLDSLKSAFQKNPQLYFDVFERIDAIANGSAKLIIENFWASGLVHIAIKNPEFFYNLVKMNVKNTQKGGKLSYEDEGGLNSILNVLGTNSMAAWALQNQQKALNFLKEVPFWHYNLKAVFFHALYKEENASKFVQNPQFYIHEFNSLEHFFAIDASESRRLHLQSYGGVIYLNMFFAHPIAFRQLLEHMQGDNIAVTGLFYKYLRGGKIFEQFIKDPKEIILTLKKYPGEPKKAMEELAKKYF